MRLSAQTVSQLSGVNTPSYDRNVLKSAIVHLGIGAFHRAHQAVYTDEVNCMEQSNWGIVGCSLRSASVQQQLQPQDGLYTVLQRGVDVSARIVGCIKEVLVGPQDPSAIVDAIASPDTRIVSLTVTEKGYCHLPASGELDKTHPDVQHDLQHLDAPRSAIGFIVAGLRVRKSNRTLGPITVMSCDNLPHNGTVTQKVVIGFAREVDEELADWIQQHVSFPCTMVDRIVPATTDSDIEQCESQFGYSDQGLVVAEPFSQWVIEDRFSQGRPAWERAGALLVEDVAVFELMKLRLLNGSHSLLAYAGYLAGCETVFDTMQNTTLKALCQRFMNSAAETLQPPEGFNLDHYQDQLIERFSNPSLKHRTWQIAMDGSQKVPQRWLNTLREVLTKNGDTLLFSFALAAWMRFVIGEDEQGQPIEISDPLAAQYQSLYQSSQGNLDRYVERFFAQESIFSSDLPHQSTLVQQTQRLVKQIVTDGINTTMENLT